jgi:threonine dehydratase
MNPLKPKYIEEAAKRLEGVVKKTPLEYSERLSKKYKTKIYLKREDLQPVRSYKIRGAYNLMSTLDKDECKRGVVCASAGNHAQGVAFSCHKLKVKGVIFMPETTPRQKVDKVQSFGDGYVKIVLTGKTFDESSKAAVEYMEKHKAVYVHPFDDYRTMAGQGTIGMEILEDLPDVECVVVPVGGGGLLGGLGTYVKGVHPTTQILAVEPEGAADMMYSLSEGRVTELPTIDPFVDGAAVKKVGQKTFKLAQTVLDDIVAVPEGQVCQTMIELYQKDGIIAEPAGALSITALEQYKDLIKGKTVVCVLSGGNNDISRYPEIVEKSLVYQGLKHYFIVEFFQKPGELMTFVTKALGPHDDIARFEYIKKTNKEKGPALVGIELAKKSDLQPLLARMNKLGIHYKYVSPDDPLYGVVV